MEIRLLSAALVFLLPCLSGAQSPALTHRAASRILEQGTWGPTPAEVQHLQEVGFDQWFAEQVAAPASTYPDQPYYNSAGNSNTNLAPVQVLFFQNALSGPDQLRQRVAFALHEIWMISELEITNAQAFPPMLRVLQQDAFGNYEQLMKDVSLNAGMGRFLNMANNDKGNPTTGTVPNENYGREIMQLFTLGLAKLNMDGSPVLDQNGNAIPTYAQADVSALSRAFTGWTYGPMPGFVTHGHNRQYYVPPMAPVEALHDTQAKQILGVTLPAGRSAEEDLADALHILFTHQNIAPFVCQQLIEHLVTSNPSPAYVQRVAETFADNGAGVRGDLKAVIYAILIDPEARAGDVASDDSEPTFGHMREPVLFLVNLLRGFNGSVSSTSTVFNAATNLGQNLFYAPSVFSYFSPQYRTQLGLLGPEFQIYSTQTAANRVNTVYSILYGGQLDAGTKFDISAFTQAASNNANLIESIDSSFFHDDMSANLKNAIGQALAPLTVPSDKAKAALYVALTSGEFQIVH